MPNTAKDRRSETAAGVTPRGQGASAKAGGRLENLAARTRTADGHLGQRPQPTEGTGPVAAWNAPEPRTAPPAGPGWPETVPAGSVTPDAEWFDLDVGPQSGEYADAHRW
ncbi:hypothetical protein AB0L12_00210 [Streptomyces cellulosae]